MNADTTIKSPHGDLPLLVSTPSKPKPWPGVVVIHDAFGRTPDLKRTTDWLAGEGFIAAAPDLFSWGGKFQCIRSIFSDIRAGKGRAFDEIEATRTWLTQQDGCNGKVGVIGFCMGGGFALMVAPNHGFSAASPNYGRLPKDAGKYLAGSCPVVASYGGKDRMLKGVPERLGEIFTANNIPHDVKEYPDAGHSFMNDHDTAMFRFMKVVLGSGYHPESAADARKRITSFFAAHLKA